MPITATPLIERLLARTERLEDGCLLWTGAVNKAGYGVIGRGRRGEGTVLVHRAHWEHVNGPIPAGMEIDHKCEIHNCLEIPHLQLLTGEQHREITLRRRRGLCRRGLHQMPTEPVPYARDHARCAECRRAYMSEYHNRKQA